MTRWIHNGKPLGQPQRPWRLTRAQRARMEACRRSMWLLASHAKYDAKCERWPSDSERRALGNAHNALGGYGCPLDDRHLWVGGYAHAWHFFRLTALRLAIALRAALRADEDARCDAMYAEGHRRGALLHVNTSEARVYRDGAALGWTVAVNAGREWLAAHRGARDEFGLVPLALWEIDERRRRETVRAVEALLTWGLS